jgi:parallel beta-helix repeat protein
VAAGVNDNVIVDNIVMGNTNGIVVLSAGAQGNLIRRNLVVGNPPVQVSVDHPALQGVDIRNLAPGVNTLEDNICLTGVNAVCPNVEGTPMRLPG